LTAPQVTPELDAARKKTSKVSREDAKRGVLWGRPSCQSSLLRDPNAKFSVEMWRKPRRHCPLPVLGPGTPAAKVLGESGYARQLSGRNKSNKSPLELRSGVDIGWPFFAPRCFVSVPLPHIPLEDSPADLILVALSARFALSAANLASSLRVGLVNLRISDGYQSVTKRSWTLSTSSFSL
jgi:hypothetical protein